MILGGRKRWRPTAENRLASALAGDIPRATTRIAPTFSPQAWGWFVGANLVFALAGDMLKKDGHHVIFVESRWETMLDLVYVLAGILLFVACWAATKACDRL
jgi:hypothetical protein